MIFEILTVVAVVFIVGALLVLVVSHLRRRHDQRAALAPIMNGTVNDRRKSSSLPIRMGKNHSAR